MLLDFRKIVVVIVAFALALPLFSETKNESGYTLRLKASKDGSEYKRGENADFVLSVSKDGKPVDGLKVNAEITKDSVPMGKTFSGETKDGKFSVSGTLNEPGFLKCKMLVSVPSGDGKKKTVDMLAGAAFDPLEIKPSLPAPDDFDAYWDRQKEILAAIPMNISMKRVEPTVKGVEAFDVQADTFNGKLSAYIAYPKNAAPGSLPALVNTQGAGVRSSGLHAVCNWAKRGFIALNFNAHGLPNGKPKEYYDNLAKGELKDYPIKNCHDRDTIFFRTLYMRLMRAMDVITSQPQWDGKNLMVCGGSQGGGQALAAGGLNGKVTVVAAMFPAICDHSGAVVGRTTGWPHFTRLDAAGNYDKKAVEAARYIDAVNFAPRIKGKVVFMINYADNVCEPTSCYAAYNSIKTPKRLFINEESRHAPAKGSYKTVENWGVDIIKESSPNVDAPASR